VSTRRAECRKRCLAEGEGRCFRTQCKRCTDADRVLWSGRSEPARAPCIPLSSPCRKLVVGQSDFHRGDAPASNPWHDVSMPTKECAPTQGCYDISEDTESILGLRDGDFWYVTQKQLLPSNRDRFDAIEKRLKDVENALPGVVLPNRKNWKLARSAVDFVRSHKGWSVGSGIAIAALLVPIVTLWYMVSSDHEKARIAHETEDFNLRVDARIGNKIGNQLTDLDQKVTAIGTSLNDLKPYIEDIVRHDFEKVAGLSGVELGKHLPAIQHLVSVAKNQAIQVNPASVNRITEKLLTIQPRPAEFWTVGTDLLSYRSLNDETRKLLTAPLPNCTDSQPTPMRLLEGPTPQKINVSSGVYENCQFTLDSAQDNQSINSILRNRTPFIVFKHCLIVYRGGDVNLTLDWNQSVAKVHIEGESTERIVHLSGQALQFENCLFVFSVQGIPPPSGQTMAERLLAQSGNTLKLPNP